MYVVSSYIVTVYRRVIECGCVWNCIVCIWGVDILLLCTDGVMNVAMFKTLLYACSYIFVVYRRSTECVCVWHSTVSVYWVFIFLLCTERVMNVAFFKMVFYVFSV